MCLERSSTALWGTLVRVEVQNLSDLSETLAQRWRDLQAMTPEFMTPLFSPDIAYLVARHRPNAKVAIGYVNDQAIAFFAFHPTANGYVRAIGAPFCDYQAIVSDPNFAIDGTNFLAKAGIASIWITSLSDPHHLFRARALEPVEAYRIYCEAAGENYMETIRRNNPKWAKNLRRLGNKMERELGPMRLVGHDISRDAYDALMTIKVAQFYETGITNVLRPKWVQDLLLDLFTMSGGYFGGCLVSLYAGDKFVAGQFGVRLGDWFHPWIASSCPASRAYSPGILFLGEILRASRELGLRVIDLSSGHAHYKSQFCRTPYMAQAGIIGPRPATAPRQDSGPLGLISRRLDLIGAVEPDLMGSIIAVGGAISAIPRRLLVRRDMSQAN